MARKANEGGQTTVFLKEHLGDSVMLPMPSGMIAKTATEIFENRRAFPVNFAQVPNGLLIHHLAPAVVQSFLEGIKYKPSNLKGPVRLSFLREDHLGADVTLALPTIGHDLQGLVYDQGVPPKPSKRLYSRSSGAPLVSHPSSPTTPSLPGGLT